VPGLPHDYRTDVIAWLKNNGYRKSKCGGASIGEKWGLFLARRSYQTKAPLVRRTPEGDQPTVAVVIGAKLAGLSVRPLTSCCRAARLDSG
jgi:hypothetical protein